MDKTTKEQNTVSTNNTESIIDECLSTNKTVHHDFTVKAMDIGSDFTVLEHKSIKKYQNKK